MALKALMLRKKIDDANKALEALRAKDAEFTSREAEISQSIEEAATEEEKAAVEEAVEAFDKEKTEHEDAKNTLERTVQDLENELEKEETEAPAVERKDEKMNEMETRDKALNQEDVKAFLTEVRSCIKEKRALTNVGLTIPTVMLGMIRENAIRYSKLLNRVSRRTLSGNGREVIMGTVPEAIWTECCANLNELDLSFNDTEIECNKVGAFISVCNASLEDSDVDLAGAITEALSQAIGMALDKAILYGTGNKMPLGIATRLAQTAKPGDYPATARPWEDLHESNIITIPATATGVDLFKQIVLASGNAKGKYSRGEKFWAMNEYTRTQLIAQALNINASGAIVSSINGIMPVIGGDAEVLDFIPDNVIIGGYGDLYLLGERRGINLERSEHYRFIQDQTVFKATARYDGKPVIAEGFVMIGINGVTPDANMIFAPDEANAVVLTSPTVSGKTGSIFGYQASDLQSDVIVSGDAIYGTLKYVDSGSLAQTWGNGYFLALDYTNIDPKATDVRVGLVPTAGSGFVSLDDDHDSAMKITNKDVQVLKVITTNGEKTTTAIYSLKGLTLESTGA